MKAAQRWTIEEDEKLIRLRKEKLTIAAIAEILCRTVNGVDARWRYLHQSEEQRQTRLNNEYARRRTARNLEPRERAHSFSRELNKPDCPPELYEARAKRNAEPRTLSQIMFGDPPFSQSALGVTNEQA